ncbi:MAG: inorganic phosphate transporter [Thermaerobacter sp.]|nr:inorganic phosphate transporter [Thermaerobacter sp.]
MAGILLVLAFNLLAGFNDRGNLLATLLPTRLRPILLWLWLAPIVSMGPFVLGTHVADTITRRVVLPMTLAHTLEPALVASLLVSLVSWWQRVPTSMSLALIGAMAGAGAAAGLPVVWSGVLRPSAPRGQP